MMTGAQGHLERLVVFPGRLSLLSCYGRFKVATVLSNLGVTKEWEPREGRRGLFQGRSKGTAGLESSWKFQLRSK